MDDYNTTEPKAPLVSPKGNKDESEPKFTAPAGTNTNGKVQVRDHKCARIK